MRRETSAPQNLVVTYQEVTKDEKQTPVCEPMTTQVIGSIEDSDLHLRAAQHSAATLFVDIVLVKVAP